MATELTVQAPIRARRVLRGPARGAGCAAADGGDCVLRRSADHRRRQGSLVVFANGIPLTGERGRVHEPRWTGPRSPAGRAPWCGSTPRAVGWPFRPVVRERRSPSPTYYGFSVGDGRRRVRPRQVARAVPAVRCSSAAVAPALERRDRGAARRRRAPSSRSTDDATYDLDDDITLAANESLTIQAANGRAAASAHRRRARSRFSPLGAGASLTLERPADRGRTAHRRRLSTRCACCTRRSCPAARSSRRSALPPTGPSLVVAPGPAAAPASTRGSRCRSRSASSGALRIPSHITKLWLLDSIVDGIERNGGPSAPSPSAMRRHASGPPAHIERSTILGTSRFLKLEHGERVDLHGQRARSTSGSRAACASPSCPSARRRRSNIAASRRSRSRSRRRGEGRCHQEWHSALAGLGGGDRDRSRALAGAAFETDRYGRPDFAQLAAALPDPDPRPAPRTARRWACSAS